MILEHEIAYFSHKNELTACFPEGNPRAFPCIERSAWHRDHASLSLTLPSVMTQLCHRRWYTCAIRYDKAVSIAMIRLYHPLPASHHVHYPLTMTIASATVVATLCYGRGIRYATVVAYALLRLWQRLSTTLVNRNSERLTTALAFHRKPYRM